MRSYRYVKLDPTGNMTCLVLDPASPEDEKILTRELLKECEQVAYLEEPVKPGAVAAVRLMGGEFCGNAAMAAAAWLVRDELAEGEEKSLLLEMSGTEEPVFCTVRKTADCYEGMVAMPPAREIREETFAGKNYTLVRMDGIVHLIYTGPEMEKQACCSGTGKSDFSGRWYGYGEAEAWSGKTAAEAAAPLSARRKRCGPGTER